MILLQTPPPAGIMSQYDAALDATAEFLGTTNNLAAALFGVILIVLAFSVVAALYLLRVGGRSQREAEASGTLVKIVADALADSRRQIENSEKTLNTIIQQFESADERHRRMLEETDKRHVESLMALSNALNYLGDLHQAQKQEIEQLGRHQKDSAEQIRLLERGVSRIVTEGSKPVQDIALELKRLIELVHNLRDGQVSSGEKLELLPKIAEDVDALRLQLRALMRDTQKTKEQESSQ